uniref:Uncharacterized protein n=1 Tax=Hippocampus comes TaxID=109280 RepID=A0A3Q3DLS4_HIPCM
GQCNHIQKASFVLIIVPAHEQHGSNFTFMDDNVPIGGPQMKWPAPSPDQNPIESLCDQLKCDVMPQQTISRLLNSMRRGCQAVIYAQGHMTSY